jgi:hypothetical protein
MDPTVQAVRHVLATLAYRFHKAVHGAPDAFAELDAGHGIRSPRAIVHHMNGVLGYLREGAARGKEGFWFEHPERGAPGTFVSTTRTRAVRIDARGSGERPTRKERSWTNSANCDAAARTGSSAASAGVSEPSSAWIR